MAEKFEIYQTGASFASNKTEATSLASKSSIGEIKNGKVVYSIYEVLYLLETKRAELIKGDKRVTFTELIKKASDIVYIVFRDLRDKGYILKEGLKFGADFRVYSKGSKPSQAHAKYLLYALSSNQKISPTNIAAKSRVAHSTNKKLLIAIVDSEEDITYLESNWINLS